MPTDKQAAKAALREELHKLREDTLSHWLTLFRGDDQWRAACGYRNGADDMVRKLADAYTKKFNKLMEPFDRGDYD